MKTAASRLPVLIVGAGPTGLTLAHLLGKYGVEYRLIERKATLSRHTKATNLMQRSQEVLHALDLLEPLDAISGHCKRLMIHGYGRTFGPRSVHLSGSPFHDILFCGQHNFEAIMADALVERGGQIEFGTALTSLRQSIEGVTVQLDGPDGPQTLECEYVVGCDGASGITRRFTKLDFQPVKTGVGLRQVDCKLSWRRLSSMEQMWLFYFDHGFAVVVPLPGGVHRIITAEPKANIPQRDPTLPEMEAKLRKVCGDDSLHLSDPDWFSYTDLSMGIAPGLRDGRVLLTGDAGNPILPNGGQGMNTGISDAFNLGWKLASVLRHGATDALLNSYDAERHTLRASLERAQHSSLKYTTEVTPAWMQTLIRGGGNALLDLGGEGQLAQAFSQLAIHTRKSPLTLETRRRGGLRAGDRALDADLVRGAGEIKLYDLIYAGGWTLLAFAGTKKADERGLLDALKAFGRPDLACYVLSTVSQVGTGLEVLYDLDELAHRTYGISQPTLLLVRPDGHIGARVGPEEIGRLLAYAERWIPAGALSGQTRRQGVKRKVRAVLQEAQASS
ncbi:FAD-dependent monooxygenase [Deinococcus sp.]|uniref:FAD-dependent monooxygenase n=1 Tax=Deinococcus sp. TaxID=47478 RepID=UPI003CC6A931